MCQTSQVVDMVITCDFSWPLNLSFCGLAKCDGNHA